MIDTSHDARLGLTRECRVFFRVDSRMSVECRFDLQRLSNTSSPRFRGEITCQRRAAKLNAGDGGIHSYGPFLERATAALGKMAKSMATPEHIATVIYGAVTDGTKRLRYLAGDDVKHLVENRRKLSDEEFENYMRAQFA